MVRLLIVGDGEPADRAAAEARRLGATPVEEREGGYERVVGVGSDDAFRRAAEIAAARGLEHPHEPVGALAGTDLGIARSALDAAGIAQPDWRECTSASDAAAAVDELSLPVVVRSLDDAVHVTIRHGDELAGAVERALSASHRTACVVEAKRGGGCSRQRRPDVDAALGCAATARVVSGEIVYARAVLRLCSPEEAVQTALGASGA